MMIRGFHILSQAWYADANLCRVNYIDEINFGMFDDIDAGTTGEMSIKWYQLRDRRPPSAKLECFDDAWKNLALFADVIEEMGEMDDSSPSPDEIAKLLVRCGFKDMTSRTNQRA